MATLTQCYPILKVANLQAAESFYCYQLGFSKESEYFLGETSGPGYMTIRRNGIWLHLSSFPGDGTTGTVVYLDVDDVDELRSELIGAGLDAEKLKIMDQTWGQREVYVHDPDGNVLRFGTPLKGGS